MAKAEPLTLQCFGEFIAPEYFALGHRALLLSVDNVYLLGRTAEDVNESFMLLTELLSLLRYMEENHIIYILDNHHFDDYNILYECSCDMKRQQNGHLYDMDNGHFLKVDNDDFEILDNQNKPILQSFSNISILKTEVVHYLFSNIYPTVGLRQFIEHDFLTDTDFFNRESVRLSRCSLWMAVFVAAISPLFSIYLGNRWGVTKLDECQLRLLLNESNSSATTTKAIEYTHEQDTIKPISRR